MAHYLIELRFFGKAKGEIKNLIREVNRRFHIRPKNRPVPHVSLAGPFSTRDERKLVNDFKGLCERYNNIKFEVDGYGTFEDNKVVYIKINPSKELEELRWQISNKIKQYCRLKPHDLEKEFYFHATIAMKLREDKFNLIKRYIASKPNPHYKHTLLRAAIIRNQKILYEYDFIQRRLFNRWEAKNTDILNKTFMMLEGKYKEPDENIVEIDLDKEVGGIFNRLFKKRRVFLISDPHFDHANIIRYCNRPFSSTSEMNETMLNNWNNTIKKEDIVLFLGDMAYGRGSRKTDHWLTKLNGKIYFIKGNHDETSNLTTIYNKLIVNYKGNKFLLVHSPQDVPKTWDGWAICGHHHNNKPEFPLVNKKAKRINVSVELIDYKPILFDELLEKVV